MNVVLNRAWADSNVEDPDSLVRRTSLTGGMTFVHDLDAGTSQDINELWNQAMNEQPIECGCDGNAVFKWTNAMLESPGQRSVKIDGIEFHWRIRPGDKVDIVTRYDATAIIRDVLTNNLLFISSAGVVSGDVEEELVKGLKK